MDQRARKRERSRRVNSYQRWKRHTKQRCDERYGLRLRAKDYRGLIQKIRSGQSRMTGRRKNGKTVHEVDFNGKILRVIYDPRHGIIRTAIPH